MKAVSALRLLLHGRQALVLGKGPSLTHAAYTAARQGRVVVGINQASASVTVDVAFFIDIEPFREIADALLASTCAVVLPWHPNARSMWRRSRSQPLQPTLLDLSRSDDFLQTLNQQGRLHYFHTRPPAVGNDNVYPPDVVSLSSLLQILGDLGATSVKTLGVDGGSGTSGILRASALQTQLRAGYDKQFQILRKIAIAKGIPMEKADQPPINIYVGCDPEQRIPARVLEHSILRNTSQPVRVQRLHEVVPAGPSLGGRTSFSMQRFMIPRLNGGREIAVYMDSDMLVFRDVKELVDLRNPSVAVSAAPAPPGSGRRPQFSVMVIDCALAHWDPETIVASGSVGYEATMFEMAFESSKDACLPYQWNSLEQHATDTCLLHFTDMDRQPWIAGDNPLAPLWIDALFSAIGDKFVSFDDLVQDVQRGWIRPGLLWQAEHGERDPQALPKRERMKDHLYAPPHTVARFSRFNNPPIRASLAAAKRVLHWARGH